MRDLLSVDKRLTEKELNSIMFGYELGLRSKQSDVVNKIDGLYDDGIPVARPRKTVLVSEIDWITERSADINSGLLSDIDWIDTNGALIHIEEKDLEEFKFTGLNNMDFARFHIQKKNGNG